MTNFITAFKPRTKSIIYSVVMFDGKRFETKGIKNRVNAVGPTIEIDNRTKAVITEKPYDDSCQ